MRALLLKGGGGRAGFLTGAVCGLLAADASAAVYKASKLSGSTEAAVPAELKAGLGCARRALPVCGLDWSGITLSGIGVLLLRGERERAGFLTGTVCGLLTAETSAAVYKASKSSGSAGGAMRAEPAVRAAAPRAAVRAVLAELEGGLAVWKRLGRVRGRSGVRVGAGAPPSSQAITSSCSDSSTATQQGARLGCIHI